MRGIAWTSRQVLGRGPLPQSSLRGRPHLDTNTPLCLFAEQDSPCCRFFFGHAPSRAVCVRAHALEPFTFYIGVPLAVGCHPFSPGPWAQPLTFPHVFFMPVSDPGQAMTCWEECPS